MAEIVKSGNVELLSGKVAVLGFGSQGHAHALNLFDSGVEVAVGLRAGSPSWSAAEDAGLTVQTPGEAVRDAQLVAMLVPDGAQPSLFGDA
ncbi:MAG: NAD(P)-binding domain-containing protein, partial [Gaiellaceae bacterium]